MKHNLSLIIGALSLAAAAGSQAQTAVTDPVGYITMKVNAAANNSSSLSFVAPTLVNKLEFSGIASAANATTITLTGATPLTANAFNAVANEAYDETPGVLMPGFYVEVSSGTGEGQWANITGNTANTLTVDRNLSTFIVGGTTTVRIRKHATINEVFGATNTAGLKGGPESALADEVKVLKPVTHAITSYFFYDDGSPDKGWLSVSNKLAGDVIILPDQGILVQRKGIGAAAGALSFVRVGHVKTGKTALYATPGFNLLSTPRAVGDNFTLANSNLGSANPDQSQKVLGALENANADIIRVPQNDGTLADFFFYDDGTDRGWLTVGNDPAGANEPLNEGEAFILLRKQSAGNMTWTAPAQPIAP